MNLKLFLIELPMIVLLPCHYNYSHETVVSLIKDKFGISWMFNCPMKYVVEKIKSEENSCQ